MNENNSPFYLQVAGGQWVAVSAAFHFNLRRAVLILRKLGAVAGFMVRPMYWLSQVCVCVCGWVPPICVFCTRVLSRCA